MRLRALIVAALIQRLRHRRAWRRRSRELASLTVADVAESARLRGAAPQDGVQEWLIARCVLDASRPRRPELARLPEDAEDGSSSDAGSW